MVLIRIKSAWIKAFTISSVCGYLFLYCFDVYRHLDYSLARSRSRRERSDKKGRLAALAKFKEARISGAKFRPEVCHPI